MDKVVDSDTPFSDRGSPTDVIGGLTPGKGGAMPAVECWHVNRVLPSQTYYNTATRRSAWSPTESDDAFTYDY